MKNELLGVENFTGIEVEPQLPGNCHTATDYL